MKKNSKKNTSDNFFCISDIDDFFGILSDRERKSLYWFYEEEPKCSVFCAPYYIPVYLINDVLFMRFKCNCGEWFVLGKYAKEKTLENLLKVYKIMDIIK